MTNQQYIASGILEIYAAGGLDGREQAEVEAMAANNPEIKAALEEICLAMEAYANLHAVTPPASLKNSILNQLSNQETAGNSIETTEKPRPETKVIDFKQAVEAKQNSNFSWLSVAAVALLVLSSVLNFYFYNNWKSTEKNLTIAMAGQQQMAANYQTVQHKLSENELAMQVLESENTKSVKLQGMPKSPASVAMVHWDAASKTVLLNVKSLPAPPVGHQYQLWALDNGKPIDAGMITMENGALALQQMKPITSAQAFAVTLEPTGGSQNPTLEEMYLMGKI